MQSGVSKIPGCYTPETHTRVAPKFLKKLENLALLRMVELQVTIG